MMLSTGRYGRRPPHDPGAWVIMIVGVLLLILMVSGLSECQYAPVLHP